jgi:hypothetical protein
VGGQKRLDRRYKDRKVWLPRNYFQIYLKTRNWEADPRDRIAIGEPESAPQLKVDRVRPAASVPRVPNPRPRKAVRK